MFNDQVSELIDILTVLILDHPEGISEHKILTLLQNPPYSFFDKGALTEPLLLFQTHFLLFHCLYKLRSRWLKNKTGMLNISALQIIKTPMPEAKTNPSKSEEPSFSNSNLGASLECADPLAQYYLDNRHFKTTTKDDVDALLSGFWKKVIRPQSTEPIEQALSVMELSPPFTLKSLKAQYRRLAQQYHPDKGGDSEHFKHICHAYHQLKYCDLSVL